MAKCPALCWGARGGKGAMHSLPLACRRHVLGCKRDGEVKAGWRLCAHLRADVLTPVLQPGPGGWVCPVHMLSAVGTLHAEPM